MNVWFLDNAGATPSESPRLAEWKQRVRSLGHGNKQAMSSTEAKGVAASSRPTAPEASDPDDPRGLQPGEAVTVTPDDYGRIPVSGELVSSSAQHIAIRREDPEVGEVVVHFPRVGFVVARD
jgi:hypothetical protein